MWVILLSACRSAMDLTLYQLGWCRHVLGWSLARFAFLLRAPLILMSHLLVVVGGRYVVCERYSMMGRRT